MRPRQLIHIPPELWVAKDPASRAQPSQPRECPLAQNPMPPAQPNPRQSPEGGCLDAASVFPIAASFDSDRPEQSGTQTTTCSSPTCLCASESLLARPSFGRCCRLEHWP